MIAAIVDGGELLQVIWVSLVAGVGVTAAFGLAILGGTRAHELAQERRMGEAAILGAVGAVAMAAVIAAIGFGIYVLVA